MPETTTALPQLEMQIRALDTEARTFSGVAVPWDDVIEVWGQSEMFARGAVIESDDALIFWRHSEPIGKLTGPGRDTDTGWEIDAQLSSTPRALEAHTLLRDGVITKLSVGFVPLEWLEREDGVRVYTKVRVREISLVPFPAYDAATITEHRNAHPNQGAKSMPETLTPEALTRADLEPIEERQRSLDAALARLADAAPAASGPQWRSSGEFLKALATGNDDALEFHRSFTADDAAGDDFRRAYTGATSADAAIANTWLADEIRLIEARRKVTNEFTREALPAEGLTLEYLQLKSNSIVVEKQASEGADLKFGKIVLESKTTPVETYGGYTELTRQQIERSSAPILNTSKRALDIEYARATEAKVRATLKAVITARLALAANVGHLASVTLATVKAVDWLDRITDAAELFEDRGHNLSGLYVSKDVFKTMYRLTDGANKNLMNVYGEGVNQTGRINVKGLEGNLANLPIKLLPGADAGTATFYDPIAITTWDQSAAPMQLQDENIINLSKTFSVYGYLAAASQFPDAILPVKFA